jgi:3D (Asp-Asp-Asp) domain-containing protein
MNGYFLAIMRVGWVLGFCFAFLFSGVEGYGRDVQKKSESAGKIVSKKKPVVKKKAVKKGKRLKAKQSGKVSSKGWKRPLLDKRMVENKRLGVGKFNSVLDAKLNGKGGETAGSREKTQLLAKQSRLSSKGKRGWTVGAGRSEYEVRGGGKNTRLGRITVYWAKGRGADRYTRRLQSATGVSLMRGHCAVDPNVIPYGSVVRVHGVGDFWAVDTGSAVKERKAAMRLGRTAEERNAIVVDLFFPERSEALAMAKRIPRFTMVSWKVLPRP